MLRVCLVVAVTVLTMSSALKTNIAYPEFAQCNKQILDVVNVFWSLKQPKNILKSMDKQNYLVTFTNYNLDYIKCIRINASSETSTYNVIFYHTDGCRPSILSYNNVEESNGTLILDGGKTKVHVITLDDNIMSIYVCNTNATSETAPTLALLANTKYIDNPLTQYISTITKNFLTRLLGKDAADFFTFADDCVFG